MFTKDQQLGEYRLIEKLGRGGFGEVWLGKKEDECFAIKLPISDQVDWKQITQEIGLWTLCGKHPNVLPLIEARNFNGQIAIISEYAPDGSLERLLKEKGKLSELKAIAFAIEILKGLQHLHENGILHRDLKPANILLKGENARLADFGISRVISGDSVSTGISGTFSFMAPECFDGKRNIQTDIWAVGIIIYRMLTGNLPFPRQEITALIASIIMGEFDRMETIENILLLDDRSLIMSDIFGSLKPFIAFAYKIYRHPYARSRNLNFEHEVNQTIKHFSDRYRFSNKQLENLEPYVWKAFNEIESGKVGLDDQLEEFHRDCLKNIRADLFGILSLALRKDPTKRYASAKDMLIALETWYDSESLMNMNRLRNAARLGNQEPLLGVKKRAGLFDPPKPK